MKKHNIFTGIWWLVAFVLAPVIYATCVFDPSVYTETEVNNLGIGMGLAIGAIDMYSTRTMLRALEQLLPTKTWLRDTLFSTVETHLTQYVDIDVQKGSRTVAAYVNPLHEGKVVDREGFETKSYKAPYTKEKMVTTAQAYLNRQQGEHIYTGADSPAARAQQQVGKDVQKLNDRIDRLEEVQASQLIQTGTVIVEGEGISQLIDFQMRADHQPVLTSTDKWSDHTNSDPFADLSTWSILMQKNSGLVPNKAILGIDAMHDFLRNDYVMKVLDTRRLIQGQIDIDALAANGVQFYGDIREAGLTIALYTYIEWYYDKIAKVEVPMIDPDKVIMVNTSARTTRHYGAIQDLKAGIDFVGARFPKSWETEDPSARWIMLQSAPLLAPHQIDGFLCATVR